MKPATTSTDRARQRRDGRPARLSLRRHASRTILAATSAALLMAATIAAPSPQWISHAMTGIAATLAIAAATSAILGEQRWRRIENWTRALAEGNCDIRIKATGRDGTAEVARGLATIRARIQHGQSLDVIRTLTESVERKNDELENALEQLRTTQDQVISTQKLAELGQLTAGVAHEIRNPLHFIRNFSEASDELIEELHELVDEQADHPTATARIGEVCATLRHNMERTREHGDRANRIIEDMLAMGRTSSGEPSPFDVNQVVNDAATLAYQAAKSAPGSERITLQRELEDQAGIITGFAQEVARVLVNLTSNACHAAVEKAQRSDDGYQPTVWLQTTGDDENAFVTVRDNGTGIPDDIADQIFRPFFTTKKPRKEPGSASASATT